MLSQAVVTRDLLDAHGAVLARRGFLVTPGLVEETARHAEALPRVALAETPLGEDIRVPVADRPYRLLFRSSPVEAGVVRAFRAARLPQPLVDELVALKASDLVRYRHALATAAITARMLITAVGDVPAVSDIIAAALLHDIGMRHVSVHLARNADELEETEIHEVAAHPLVGAWRLASVLGRHPAVEAALAHHWKNGHGYPALSRDPMRAVEVVSIASAFAALTQVRAFRPHPYDARGAVDVLVAEANMGHRAVDTVRLLVHTLRGARGDVASVRFGRARLGHAPVINRHTPISALRLDGE